MTKKETAMFIGGISIDTVEGGDLPRTTQCTVDFGDGVRLAFKLKDEHREIVRRTLEDAVIQAIADLSGEAIKSPRSKTR